MGLEAGGGVRDRSMGNEGVALRVAGRDWVVAMVRGNLGSFGSFDDMRGIRVDMM